MISRGDLFQVHATGTVEPGQVEMGGRHGKKPPLADQGPETPMAFPHLC